MRHYATGQGMTLNLNGYETNMSLLMMFRLIPFLEVYKLRNNDDVFTERIHFSNNIRDDDRLMEPLFNFLHSYEGDILSTYEILFKYYRCANYINKKQLSTLKRKLDSIEKTLSLVVSILPFL